MFGQVEDGVLGIIRRSLPLCAQVAKTDSQSRDITLRELTPEDAEAYYGTIDNDRVRSHLGQYGLRFAEVCTIDDAERLLRRGSGRLRLGIFASNVAQSTTGSIFLGAINIFLQQNKEAEVEYWVLPEHTGHGYCTAALLAVAQCLNEHGWTTLASIHSENKSSQNVAENAGFGTREHLGSTIMYAYPPPLNKPDYRGWPTY